MRRYGTTALGQYFRRRGARVGWVCGCGGWGGGGVPSVTF